MPDPQLTPHFNLREFRCPCCGDVYEANARRLAEALEPVREEYGPLQIYSGFRCPRQNAKVGGALFSQHLAGLAADIACQGDHDRYLLLRLLLKHGFNRLGIAAKYIHADLGKTQTEVCWTYYHA